MWVNVIVTEQTPLGSNVTLPAPANTLEAFGIFGVNFILNDMCCGVLWCFHRWCTLVSGPRTTLLLPQRWYYDCVASVCCCFIPLQRRDGRAGVA